MWVLRPTNTAPIAVLFLRWQAKIGASKPEAERERPNQEAVSAHGDIRPLEETYVRSALNLLS